ncbi:MAG: hypothetical protein H7A24_08620 [Leptospiraceae bacterium]|nr:hypothetical protein [Leptospiraceae bacterium]
MFEISITSLSLLSIFFLHFLPLISLGKDDLKFSLFRNASIYYFTELLISLIQIPETAFLRSLNEIFFLSSVFDFGLSFSLQKNLTLGKRFLFASALLTLHILVFNFDKSILIFSPESETFQIHFQRFSLFYISNLVSFLVFITVLILSILKKISLLDVSIFIIVFAIKVLIQPFFIPILLNSYWSSILFFLLCVFLPLLVFRRKQNLSFQNMDFQFIIYFLPIVIPLLGIFSYSHWKQHFFDELYLEAIRIKNSGNIEDKFGSNHIKFLTLLSSEGQSLPILTLADIQKSFPVLPRDNSIEFHSLNFESIPKIYVSITRELGNKYLQSGALYSGYSLGRTLFLLPFFLLSLLLNSAILISYKILYRKKKYYFQSKFPFVTWESDPLIEIDSHYSTLIDEMKKKKSQIFHDKEGLHSALINLQMEYNKLFEKYNEEKQDLYKSFYGKPIDSFQIGKTIIEITRKNHNKYEFENEVYSAGKFASGIYQDPNDKDRAILFFLSGKNETEVMEQYSKLNMCFPRYEKSSNLFSILIDIIKKIQKDSPHISIFLGILSSGVEFHFIKKGIFPLFPVSKNGMKKLEVPDVDFNNPGFNRISIDDKSYILIASEGAEYGFKTETGNPLNLEVLLKEFQKKEPFSTDDFLIFCEENYENSEDFGICTIAQKKNSRSSESDQESVEWEKI